MLGILLVDKPIGLTSHDVVSRARRVFSTKRVGHAGTLDPQATGLLVLAVGPATRFLQYLPLEPKEYLGTITFGVTTNSFDAEGEITDTQPVPANLEELIQEHLPKFRGGISQLPPMFSAVKKAGKPLYTYARKGEEVERAERRVVIDTYDIVKIDGPHVDVRIICSGGTYVRSLAHDLGQAVGCGAHLSALRRTRIGKFSVEEARVIDDFGPEDLWSLDQALPPTPVVKLNEGQLRHIQHGQPARLRETPSYTHVALADPDGMVVGVGRVHGELVHPEIVIPFDALYELETESL